MPTHLKTIFQGVALLLLLCPFHLKGEAVPQLHTPKSLKTLAILSGKESLTEEECRSARQAMLTLNNEARSNSEYRMFSHCEIDVELPEDLSPLTLDNPLTAAMQKRAEHLADLGEIPPTTSDNVTLPGYHVDVRCHDLADFRLVWLKNEGDAHLPTWNLQGRIVDAVGYGLARSAKDDMWYVSVSWANLDVPSPHAFKLRALTIADDVTGSRQYIGYYSNRLEPNGSTPLRLASTDAPQFIALHLTVVDAPPEAFALQALNFPEPAGVDVSQKEAYLVPRENGQMWVEYLEKDEITRGGLAFADPLDRKQIDTQGASFESRFLPNWFLRHQKTYVKLHPPQNPTFSARDATWFHDSVKEE